MKNNIILLKCPPITNERERISLVYDTIETWIRSVALSRLVDSYGSKIPDNLDIGNLVTWLLNFSEQWDFRKLQKETAARDIGEGARWLVNDSQFTQQQRIIIKKYAKVLGLIGVSKPIKKSYDYVLVLGGARLSCLLRPRLAAKIISNFSLPPKSVILLASSRPVAITERDATDTYAPNAINEFDLINTGAEISFKLIKDYSEERSDDPININKSWVIRKYNQKTLNTTTIISISAPSSEPEKRRANSADTYEFLFSKLDVPFGSSLLLVTSQIYVPYQQLEAIRTIALKYNVVIETVGFPTTWGGKLQGMNSPSNYLQEIRSTIQSADRFLKMFPK